MICSILLASNTRMWALLARIEGNRVFGDILLVCMCFRGVKLSFFLSEDSPEFRIPQSPAGASLDYLAEQFKTTSRSQKVKPSFASTKPSIPSIEEKLFQRGSGEYPAKAGSNAKLPKKTRRIMRTYR